MKKIKLVAAAAALLVLGSVGGVNPVEASQGAVVVRGTQTPVGDGHSYTMSGDLIGDWNTTSFHELGFTPSGALRGAGTELFVGCFDANGTIQRELTTGDAKDHAPYRPALTTWEYTTGDAKDHSPYRPPLTTWEYTTGDAKDHAGYRSPYDTP